MEVDKPAKKITERSKSWFCNGLLIRVVYHNAGSIPVARKHINHPQKGERYGLGLK